MGAFSECLKISTKHTRQRVPPEEKIRFLEKMYSVTRGLGRYKLYRSYTYTEMRSNRIPFYNGKVGFTVRYNKTEHNTV